MVANLNRFVACLSVAWMINLALSFRLRQRNSALLQLSSPVQGCSRSFPEQESHDQGVRESDFAAIDKAVPRALDDGEQLLPLGVEQHILREAVDELLAGPRWLFEDGEVALWETRREEKLSRGFGCRLGSRAPNGRQGDVRCAVCRGLEGRKTNS